MVFSLGNALGWPVSRPAEALMSEPLFIQCGGGAGLETGQAQAHQHPDIKRHNRKLKLLSISALFCGFTLH